MTASRASLFATDIRATAGAVEVVDDPDAGLAFAVYIAYGRRTGLCDVHHHTAQPCPAGSEPLRCLSNVLLIYYCLRRRMKRLAPEYPHHRYRLIRLRPPHTSLPYRNTSDKSCTHLLQIRSQMIPPKESQHSVSSRTPKPHLRRDLRKLFPNRTEQ